MTWDAHRQSELPALCLELGHLERVVVHWRRRRRVAAAAAAAGVAAAGLGGGGGRRAARLTPARATTGLCPLWLCAHYSGNAYYGYAHHGYMHSMATPTAHYLLVHACARAATGRARRSRRSRLGCTHAARAASPSCSGRGARVTSPSCSGGGRGGSWGAVVVVEVLSGTGIRSRQLGDAAILHSHYYEYSITTVLLPYYYCTTTRYCTCPRPCRRVSAPMRRRPPPTGRRVPPRRRPQRARLGR
eukprot:scaffold35643_cov51-Phaeocystis_antarctica.AAC.1